MARLADKKRAAAHAAAVEFLTDNRLWLCVPYVREMAIDTLINQAWHSPETQGTRLVARANRGDGNASVALAALIREWPAQRTLPEPLASYAQAMRHGEIPKKKRGPNAADRDTLRQVIGEAIDLVKRNHGVTFREAERVVHAALSELKIAPMSLANVRDIRRLAKHCAS